jgi:hypothetical protein
MQQTPPANLSQPQLALWWLKQGDFRMGDAWEKAHLICQSAEGTRDYDLVHALAHWIEGDASNRDYWYRRVSGWTRADSIEGEWQCISDAVG